MTYTTNTPAGHKSPDKADASPLWYTDPTGEKAVRHLMPGQWALTDSEGFTIWFHADSLRPALALYSFTATRTGLALRARLKKKDPINAAPTAPGSKSETLTAK